MTVGLRIAERQPRVDAALVARAAMLPAANIGDVMNRMQAMRGGFRPYGGRRAFAGPALTGRVRPGDNLFMHRAVDLAQPGDVIVCDGGGDLSVAVMGDLMASHAVKRRVGACVVDGAVRDVAALARLDLGVWARGATPAGPTRRGPARPAFPSPAAGWS